MRKELLILSGKGGTGKSTVSVNLALRLCNEGHRVGLLDCDLTTPNIPKMLGMGKVKLIADQVIDPVVINDNLKVMSVGFDASDNQGILWDGSRIRAIVGELINGVGWGELDYLIVDMPPGSSDDLIEAIQDLPNSYAIIVMIPSVTAQMDASKLIKVLKLKDIPILGVIENMSKLFGDGLGEELANEYEIPFLGKLEFHPEVPKEMARGNNILGEFDDFEIVMTKLTWGLNVCH